MKTYLIGTTLLILLVACQQTQNQSAKSEASDSVKAVTSFTPEITYAKHFTIAVHDNFKSVIVKNPWVEDDTLVSYVLYSKEAAAPFSVDWAEFVIPVPIDEVVTTSSPHIGLIGLLDELDKITGVSNDRYVYNPHIYKKISEGQSKNRTQLSYREPLQN